MLMMIIVMAMMMMMMMMMICALPPARHLHTKQPENKLVFWDTIWKLWILRSKDVRSRLQSKLGGKLEWMDFQIPHMGTRLTCVGKKWMRCFDANLAPAICTWYLLKWDENFNNSIKSWWMAAIPSYKQKKQHFQCDGLMRSSPFPHCSRTQSSRPSKNHHHTTT